MDQAWLFLSLLAMVGTHGLTLGEAVDATGIFEWHGTGGCTLVLGVGIVSRAVADVGTFSVIA